MPAPRVYRPPARPSTRSPLRPPPRLPATGGARPSGLARTSQPRGGAQPSLLSDPLLQRAQQETTVRYGPEHFALSQLMQQALSDLINRVQIARAAAAGQQRTADIVRPAMQQAYEQGQSAVQDAYKGLGKHVDKGFKGAIKHEKAAAEARVGEGMAGALAEVDARKLDASGYEAGQTNQAVQDYMGTTSQVGQRQEALAQEEGAFTTATFGDLVAAKQAAKEKADQQALQNRHNLAMEHLGLLGVQATLHGQDLGHQDRIATAQLAHADRVRGQDISRANALTSAGASAAKPSAASLKIQRGIVAAVRNASYGLTHGWTAPQIRANLQSRAKGHLGAPPEIVSAAFQIINSGGAISPTTHRMLTGPLGYTGLRRTGYPIPYPVPRRATFRVRGRASVPVPR